MQEATVGSKYQIVIPKEVRRKMKGLKPGDKVSVQRIDEKTITIKAEEKTWLERTRGMMTEAWKGIDTTKEIEKMRDEWEERLRDLEKELK